MVKVPQPEPVVLRPEEDALLQRIVFEPGGFQQPQAVRSSCSAAAQLAGSLLNRRAIPEDRLRYFTDAELNIGGHGRSRADVFESNGARGDAMLRHPHFLKYLKYFLYGPDLPAETVARFRQIVIDDAGTSGMILDQLRRFARAEARRLSSGRRTDVHEEFFKLALECDLELGVARSVRDAVREAK